MPTCHSSIDERAGGLAVREEPALVKGILPRLILHVLLAATEQADGQPRDDNACHPERTREGSGPGIPSQILRGVPLRMTGGGNFRTCSHSGTSMTSIGFKVSRNCLVLSRLNFGSLDLITRK